FRQADALCENLRLGARAQPPHGFRIVVYLDAGLDRLPVAQGRNAAVAVHQGRRHRRFADACIRAADEEALHAFIAVSSAVMNRSSISSLSPWFTATRKRAVPSGTVGGRIARTSKPAACSSRETATACWLSPMITGTIGES